jgi:dolichol kinase
MRMLDMLDMLDTLRQIAFALAFVAVILSAELLVTFIYFRNLWRTRYRSPVLFMTALFFRWVRWSEASGLRLCVD